MSVLQELKLPAEVKESLLVNHLLLRTTNEMRKRARVNLVNGRWIEKITTACNDVIRIMGVDDCRDAAWWLEDNNGLAGKKKRSRKGRSSETNAWRNGPSLSPD